MIIFEKSTILKNNGISNLNSIIYEKTTSGIYCQSSLIQLSTVTCGVYDKSHRDQRETIKLIHSISKVSASLHLKICILGMSQFR